MSNADYLIRLGRVEDSEDLCYMFISEGWHVTLPLVKDLFLNQPEGSFVATMKSGEIISHCHGTILDDERGSLEWLLTKPEYRGRGIGMKLYKLVIDYLGDRNICISAASHMVPMYKKLGFKVTSFTICLFQWIPKIVQQNICINDIEVKILDDSLLPGVLQYDGSLQPSDRTNIVKTYFAELCEKTYVALKGTQVVGYGCLTLGRYGYRLMPLYANDENVATVLCRRLLSHVTENKMVEVGFMFRNKESVMKAFEGTGIKNAECVEVVRMYSKFEEKVSYSSIYSIMNFIHCIV